MIVNVIDFTLLHEPDHDIGMFAWNAGHISFPVGARTTFKYSTNLSETEL